MADIRILINDKSTSDLKAPSSGQYRARDTQLKGFHVIVGRRSKTFAVQGDLRKDGKRVASISVRIGDAETMSTREARATAKTYLAQISKGEHPNPKTADMPAHANDTSQVNGDEAAQPDVAPKGVTPSSASSPTTSARRAARERRRISVKLYRHFH
ncbi:integrase arm-type DNA-binding domain-containing protein [Mesorhizobium sp. LjRoot246]|uniref:integrase arm-type DNA-binding domain-containing protein n=1 Tax=Mesorhizobium sp. LjRoot246 TaxID=3342294 RepID=UPI003ED0AC7E